MPFRHNFLTTSTFMGSRYHRTHIRPKSQAKKEGNFLNVKTRVCVCVCVYVYIYIYTHNKQDTVLEESISVESANVTDIA